MSRNQTLTNTAPMRATPMRTQPLPEMPTREKAAMRTQLMATHRMEHSATRVSELPAQMAAALAKIAEAAARFATNEARACVRMVLVALDVGALEQGRRYVEAYARRVGFVGEPAPSVQAELRAELEIAYGRMSPEQRRRFDALFADLRRSHPKVWLVRPL